MPPTRCRGSARYGPFVYRLGRKIFILERAVRFCYGLPQQSVNHSGLTLCLVFLYHKTTPPHSPLPHQTTKTTIKQPWQHTSDVVTVFSRPSMKLNENHTETHIFIRTQNVLILSGLNAIPIKRMQRGLPRMLIGRRKCFKTVLGLGGAANYPLVSGISPRIIYLSFASR